MEERESWSLLKDRRKIHKIFYPMVSRTVDLRVFMDEENDGFLTRAIWFSPEEISPLGSEPEGIIENCRIASQQEDNNP